MKYPLAASLTAAALLALTLSPKLVAAETPQRRDNKVFVRDITRLLADAGFQTRSERRPLGVAVFGTRPGCAIMIRESVPHGTYLNVLEQLARPYGRLRFIYRGRISETAPKALPLLDFYIFRELGRIGIRIPRAPILAVAAKPDCDVGGIPWNRVATLEA